MSIQASRKIERVGDSSDRRLTDDNITRDRPSGHTRSLGRRFRSTGTRRRQLERIMAVRPLEPMPTWRRHCRISTIGEAARSSVDKK
jgi:hypothetical protein